MKSESSPKRSISQSQGKELSEIVQQFAKHHAVDSVESSLQWLGRSKFHESLLIEKENESLEERILIDQQRYQNLEPQSAVQKA